MSKKHYDEVSVIRSLSRKNEIRVDTKKQVIEVVKNPCNVGNGSWGKIDYLIKVHGYTQIFVKNLGGKFSSNANVKELSVPMTKRDKINMSAMSKSAMKRVKDK